MDATFTSFDWAGLKTLAAKVGIKYAQPACEQDVRAIKATFGPAAPDREGSIQLMNVLDALTEAFRSASPITKKDPRRGTIKVLPANPSHALICLESASELLARK